jgi:TRAP-type mannitol/chloroaromatic compound transport system permease large subunit
MINKINKLEQLFESKNKKMQQAIQNDLLRKNKLKVRVKSLSKTTVLTIVALIGAVVFSVSFAWFLASF